MYSETHKPGMKQFFSGLLMMLMIYLVSGILKGAFPSHTALVLIVSLLLCCVAVYVVYIRYAAEYTYTLGKKELTVCAKAGKRTDELSVKYKDIDLISRKRCHMPLSRKKFTQSIFFGKNRCRIIYGKRKKGLIFEPENEFYEKLKEYVK